MPGFLRLRYVFVESGEIGSGPTGFAGIKEKEKRIKEPLPAHNGTR